MCDQVSPIETPKSSVMRLAKSTEISHCVAGGISAVLDQPKVGTDSSSATQGSSVASVAGKNRAPAKQWAKASAADRARKMSATANAREQLEQRSMSSLPMARERTRSLMRPRTFTAPEGGLADY